MGKTILTPKQFDFLELAQAQASIIKRFYLTGGTALAQFYFQHRLSEDIDLFSEKEVKPSAIESFLQGISIKLGISKIVKENFLGLYTYKLPRTENPQFSLTSLQTYKKTLAQYTTYPAEDCNYLSIESRFKKAGFSCNYNFLKSKSNIFYHKPIISKTKPDCQQT